MWGKKTGHEFSKEFLIELGAEGLVKAVKDLFECLSKAMTDFS